MRKKRKTTVALTGKLGLREAFEVHQQLKQAIERFETVRIDVRKAATLDISIIQLLVAARKYAQRLERSLSVVSTADSPFEVALVRAGMLGAGATCRTDGERFWTPEEARKS